MDHSKVLQSYPPEKISQIINICDNLFYNNYLSTGELKSSNEIKSKIKEQVAETFTSFWGQSHSQKIQDKANSTNLSFLYQTIGPRNSIENFLKQTKVTNFNKTNGTNFENPQCYEFVSWLLSHHDNDIKSLIETSNSTNLEMCLQQLGTTKEEILNNDSLAKLIISQINDLGQKWKTTQYSENSEINANMQILEEFVDHYRQQTTQEIRQECISQGITDKNTISNQIYKAFSVNYYGVRKDPIALTLAPNPADWELFRFDNDTEAYYRDGTVSFGISPSDLVVLHEFIHAVDGAGFEKGHREKGKTEYSNQFRENEMFNEVITDYFAVIMYNERARNGKGVIVNSESFESSYSQLFGIMDKFLSSYLPELKETRIREYPAEEFMRVIGKNQFENIAVLCNEMIELSHDRNILDIAEISGIKKQELSELLQGVTNNQSRIRQFINLIGRNSEQLASKLQSKNSPHLQRFAQLLYGTSNTIGNITQQHIAKSLDSPIKGLDLEHEDELVMTMN